MFYWNGVLGKSLYGKENMMMRLRPRANKKG